MKIAVLSDTHIPARLQTLPGQVYEACADVDLIIHAGDIEDTSVIDDLLRLAPVKAVSGNMDGLEVSNRFPDTLNMELQDFTVSVAHGSGPYHNVRKRLRKKFQSINPDIIIHGHTHIFHWKKEHSIWFLCPGAVSNSKGSRSMAVLTLEKEKLPQVEKIPF
ncbi:MAG: metallophosphatase family protein [Candidatus Sabulitectum sp.]|nr:metallophosphatase family protein [Candidatus Sabulitectum sp.]